MIIATHLYAKEKCQEATVNDVKFSRRVNVKERAQRETEFAQREREVQTQITTMQQHME